MRSSFCCCFYLYKGYIKSVHGTNLEEIHVVRAVFLELLLFELVAVDAGEAHHGAGRMLEELNSAIFNCVQRLDRRNARQMVRQRGLDLRS